MADTSRYEIGDRRPVSIRREPSPRKSPQHGATEDSEPEKEEFDDVYKIGRLVTSYLSGDVYRVTRIQTGEEFACKFVSFSTRKSYDVQREIEICQILDHKNVAKLVDYYSTKVGDMIVYDMVWGMDLLEYLSSIDGYTELQISVLMKQILSGVQYLHENDIIHRHLTAESIVVCRKAAAESNVKIVNFSEAIQTDGGKTFNYGMAGRKYYMAPEMINGNPYGKPVDMWSCGVVLLIMLVGEAPFYDPRASLWHQIHSGKLSLEDTRDHPFSKQARNLLLGLLQPHPEMRLHVNEAIEDTFVEVKSFVAAQDFLRRRSADLTKFVRKSKAIVAGHPPPETVTSAHRYHRERTDQREKEGNKSAGFDLELSVLASVVFLYALIVGLVMGWNLLQLLCEKFNLNCM